MSFIYALREKSQPFLKTFAGFLAKKNVTPNQITIATLIGSLVVGLLLFLTPYSFKWLYALPIWLFIRIMLNMLDGLLADQTKQVTPLGGVLNEAEHVISDLFLYLPLMALEHVAAWTILIFIVATFSTEFCGVLMQARGADRQNQGPLAKFDRAIYIGILALLTALIPGLITLWNLLFFIGIVLCVITCKNRVVGGLEKLNKKRKR